MNRRDLIGLGCAGAASALCSGPAAAVPNVARSIVQVIASGFGFDGVERQAIGTGFMTGWIGYIATSQHLRKQLGDIDPVSVSYTIRLDPRSSYALPASVHHEHVPSDVLVLFCQAYGLDMKPMRRARKILEQVQQGSTDIYTAGFPSGYGLTVDRGVLKSFVGSINPPIPTWTTSLTFKSGQSGSPIFLGDGTVIGIAKGVDQDATSIGLIVPAMLVPEVYWAQDSEGTNHVEIAEASTLVVSSRDGTVLTQTSAAGTESFAIPGRPEDLSFVLKNPDGSVRQLVVEQNDVRRVGSELRLDARSLIGGESG